MVYGDLIIVYPKPYSIYLRGTISARPSRFRDQGLRVSGARQELSSVADGEPSKFCIVLKE